MKYNRIVVTGSIGYDHIMSMPGVFADHIMPDKLQMINVSFIMKTFRKEFGGTGGNIAYSLALLGVPTCLVGSVGSDFGIYKKHLLKLKSLDIGQIKQYEQVSSAQGFVMADGHENQIWGYYEGAMGLDDKNSLKDVLEKGDFLVIAPNNPKAMMKYVREAIEAKVPFMFDPAFNIAHFTENDLRLAVRNCSVLIGNDYEMEMIRRRIKNKELRIKQRQIRITTLGSRGSVIEVGGEKYEVPVVKVKNVSDPTGAGDAYRAGFLAGYVADRPMAECGRMGAVAAAYTVEKYGTQTHRFDGKIFWVRYAKNFGKTE